MYVHSSTYLHIYNLTTFLPNPFYLQVTVPVSFLELLFGGLELGVNLAFVVKVLGWVECIIILILILVIILVLLFLFLFLFLFLHYTEPLSDSTCSSLFLLDQLLLSSSFLSQMFLIYVITQLIF